MPVIVKPISANLVKDKDTFGKSDPYCIITIGNEKQRTRTCNGGGKSPQWTDTLHFNSTDYLLRVSVWDEDTFSRDDLIGEGTVNLNQLYQNPNHTENEYVDLVNAGKSAGRLLLSIEYQGGQMTNNWGNQGGWNQNNFNQGGNNQGNWGGNNQGGWGQNPNQGWSGNNQGGWGQNPNQGWSGNNQGGWGQNPNQGWGGNQGPMNGPNQGGWGQSPPNQGWSGNNQSGWGPNSNQGGWGQNSNQGWNNQGGWNPNQGNNQGGWGNKGPNQTGWNNGW